MTRGRSSGVRYASRKLAGAAGSAAAPSSAGVVRRCGSTDDHFWAAQGRRASGVSVSRGARHKGSERHGEGRRPTVHEVVVDEEERPALRRRQERFEQRELQPAADSRSARAQTAGQPGRAGQEAGTHGGVGLHGRERWRRSGGQARGGDAGRAFEWRLAGLTCVGSKAKIELASKSKSSSRWTPAQSQSSTALELRRHLHPPAGAAPILNGRPRWG